MTRMKATLFLIGLFLFGFSMLYTGPEMLERRYQEEMAKKYSIEEINGFDTEAPKAYHFKGNIIRTEHTLTGEAPYLDGWDRLVHPADLIISINGEATEFLNDYPVLLGRDFEQVEGLNQYGNYLSYWLVKDKTADTEFFAVTYRLNGNRTKQIVDGYMEGDVPREEFRYKLIMIQPDGTVEKELFSYEDKSKLQTQLISPSYSGPVGYYTDSLTSYPNFLIPFIYPWLTTVVGLLLMLIWFPYQWLFQKIRRTVTASATNK
ncbi:MAG: hypothetical protein ACQEV0_04140 [Bacillota bacterium]